MAWIIVDNSLLAHVFSTEYTIPQIFILAVSPRLNQCEASHPMVRLEIRPEHRQCKSLLYTVVAGEYSDGDDLPKGTLSFKDHTFCGLFDLLFWYFFSVCAL